jgi:hypothetical protein
LECSNDAGSLPLGLTGGLLLLFPYTDWTVDVLSGPVGLPAVPASVLAISYYKYYWVEEWSRGTFLAAEIVGSLASIALIGAAMWYRTRPTPKLFRYALPLIVAIGIAFTPELWVPS